MSRKAALLLGGGLVAVAAATLLALRSVGPAPPAPPDPAAEAATDLPTLLRTADVRRGAAVFGQCAACHSVGRDGPDLDGPNLYGVVGNPVAHRRPRYGYTAALHAAGGRWTPERLDAWLEDPRKFAPGTSMPFLGLPRARDRADVIAFLNTYGGQGPLP